VNNFRQNICVERSSFSSLARVSNESKFRLDFDPWSWRGEICEKILSKITESKFSLKRKLKKTESGIES
jgi:hypothetical protein